jgi:hypothetical protein
MKPAKITRKQRKKGELFLKGKFYLEKFFFLFLFENDRQSARYDILSIAKDKAKIELILFDGKAKELRKSKENSF